MNPTPPLFLIGAGFNRDAQCDYPLVGDLLECCFDLKELPIGRPSIETLFQESIENGKYDPLKKLSNNIQECDHNLEEKLKNKNNLKPYRDFFNHFQRSNFITFNYDLFVEQFLIIKNRWHPSDGFGIDCGYQPKPENASEYPSLSKVIHLHGCFYLHPTNYDIDQGKLKLRGNNPKFSFSPRWLKSTPYSHILGVGAGGDQDYIIAPVPNKSEHSQDFVKKVEEQALKLAKNSTLISIGYKFNPLDKDSFTKILEIASTLTIVSPDKSSDFKWLKETYPNLKVNVINKYFRDWAATGFNWNAENIPSKKGFSPLV